MRMLLLPSDLVMESLVLCPEELCLGPVRSPLATPMPSMLLGVSPATDLTICTVESLEKGTRFLPWKGTVRSDKLPVFDKLPEFDVSVFSEKQALIRIYGVRAR